jgi:hypothetical protein
MAVARALKGVASSPTTAAIVTHQALSPTCFVLPFSPFSPFSSFFPFMVTLKLAYGMRTISKQFVLDATLFGRGPGCLASVLGLFTFFSLLF